jgi:hypothetical protein
MVSTKSVEVEAPCIRRVTFAEFFFFVSLLHNLLQPGNGSMDGNYSNHITHNASNEVCKD